ncbi:hypothetical protein [Phytomonospora endophytica]|uniref:Uncharacterized protein n=1 Tax=Phytomonospora endophytica TaxID=714109 RepID=A0A841FHV2_9ACTN|nr:hypothetical protein [Phytomonospora endophytica]MBB6036921.1 hypothetical protein [Phytomonospora endophytica]
MDGGGAVLGRLAGVAQLLGGKVGDGRAQAPDGLPQLVHHSLDR